MKRWKHKLAGLLSLALLVSSMALCLTACGGQANQDATVGQDAVAGQDPTVGQEGLTLCAGLTEKEIEEYADALYLRCHEMPEILASTMSAFPIAAKAATNLEDVDALSLDYEMSCAWDGGAVQEQLLETLRALLAGSRTEIEMYFFTGEAESYLITLGDEELVENYSPRSAQLRTSTETYEELMVLKVTANYEDGTQESGYFNADSWLRVMIDDE